MFVEENDMLHLLEPFPCLSWNSFRVGGLMKFVVFFWGEG